MGWRSCSTNLPATTQTYTLKLETTRVAPGNIPLTGIAKSITATYTFKTAAGDTSLGGDSFWPRMIPQGVSETNTAAGGSSFLAGLVAVLVWLAGNAAVWACLFLLPQLEAVAVIPRLVVGVLATFYLLYLARGAAAWVRRQSGPAPPAGGDPIS